MIKSVDVKGELKWLKLHGHNSVEPCLCGIPTSSQPRVLQPRTSDHRQLRFLFLRYGTSSLIASKCDVHQKIPRLQKTRVWGIIEANNLRKC